MSQKPVGAHVMTRRCRSSLSNVSVIRFALTVEEKRSKKKSNCVLDNLQWSQQEQGKAAVQQGVTPMMLRILIQIKRSVSSTAAFRISQEILSICLALVTCKLSDIPSSLLYFRVVQMLYTVKGR